MEHDDFGAYMRAQERTARCAAESAAAQKRYENAKIEERAAELMSQHEPVASWNIDREKLRKALRYVLWGRIEDEVSD